MTKHTHCKTVLITTVPVSVNEDMVEPRHNDLTFMSETTVRVSHTYYSVTLIMSSE